MDFETVYGVDFSAHGSKAGYRTWVTEAVLEENRLEVRQSRCAFDFFEDNPSSRAETLESLVQFFADEDDAIVGLDFPFSLPEAVADECFEANDWRAFLMEFPGEWESPSEMFHAVNDAEGFEGNVARATDEEHDGQPPTGWRIKTQTYYGISGVLAPLVAEHDARAAPFFTDGDGVSLLEAYPAGLFDELGLHRSGYKDVPEASRARRKENVRGLQHRGVVLPDEAACVAMHNDDALDSVAAAHATWRNMDAFSTDGADSGVEGRIYV